MSNFAEGVPTVDIQLGGKAYTLGWTWAAKRHLKEALERRGSSLGDQAAIAENLPLVLWASLDRETRSEVSVEDLEELIHPGNELEVATKIGELFKVSEPDPDPKTQPVAVKEPTTGMNSSESGQSASLTFR